MVNVDNKTAMVFCVYDHEGLQIQYESEDDHTNISLWQFGARDRKTTIKTKLKYIWRIIKHGTPYGDQVILDKIGRSVLIEVLQNHGILEPEIIVTATT